MSEATVVLETYEGDVIVPVRHCSCFDACRHAHIARGHNGRAANVKCVSPRYEKHWQLRSRRTASGTSARRRKMGMEVRRMAQSRKTADFVTRTVRKGKVLINGHWYAAPASYDGRLDGMRMVFGVYRYSDGNSVTLWGSEEFGRCKDPNRWDDEGMRLEVVDGELPWMFWKKVTR